MSKIIKITGIIMALSLTLAGLAFSAESEVTITPKWSDLNPDAKECDGFSEDNLVLKIKINRTEITKEICSSYGNADAKVITDARGVKYLILKTAKGRGTHVTSEYLTVYRIEKDLKECAHFPVYEPIGRLSGYYHDHKIKKPRKGGLIFVLTPRIEDVAEDAEWFPKEKKREIKIK